MVSRDLTTGLYKPQKALVLCVIRHDGSNFSVESMVRTASTLAAKFCHIGLCMMQDVWLRLARLCKCLLENRDCVTAWGCPISFAQSKEDAVWEAVDAHGQHFL